MQRKEQFSEIRCADPSLIKGSYFSVWTWQKRKYANEKMTAESREEKKCPVPQSQINTYQLIPFPIPLLSHWKLHLKAGVVKLAGVEMWTSTHSIQRISWESPFNPERRGQRQRSERAESGPESKEWGQLWEPEPLKVFSLQTTIKVYSHFLRLNKPLNPKTLSTSLKLM